MSKPKLKTTWTSSRGRRDVFVQYEAQTGIKVSDLTRDQLEWIYRAWTEFEFFLERVYFPHELYGTWTVETAQATNLYGFQRTLAHIMQYELPIHQKITIEAPTGSTKTDTVGKGYPLWRAGRDPSIRIGLFTHDQRKSTRHMTKFMSHFESNEGYKFVFGPMTDIDHQRHSVWNLKEISVRQQGGRGNITITSATYGGESEGLPFDLIIEDDVVGDKESRTMEASEKAWMWQTKVVENRLRADTDNPEYGLIASIGTRQADRDLHARLQELEDWHHYRFKAIVRDAIPKDPLLGRKGLYDVVEIEGGGLRPVPLPDNYEVPPVVLLPERRGFRYHELCRERDIKPFAFAQKKQNEVRDERAKLFPRDMLQNYCRADGRYNPDGILKPKLRAWNIQEGRPEDYALDFARVILSVDLAATAASKGRADPDYSVFFLYGITPDKTRVVLDIFRMRTGSPTRQREELLRRYQLYHPTVPPIVEANACQRLWAQDVIDQLGIPLRKEELKASKLDEIESAADLAQSGKFLYCWDENDPQTMHVMSAFENELTAYPDGRHDDMLMALLLAERHALAGGEIGVHLVRKHEDSPRQAVAQAIPHNLEEMDYDAEMNEQFRKAMKPKRDLWRLPVAAGWR